MKRRQLKIALLAFWLVGTPGILFAQVNYELNPEVQRKMSSLVFLEGKWRGSGWMIGEDRTRLSFEQEELVTMKLNGTILEIEGVGKANGKTVHHALAIVQPKSEEGGFDFTSFLQSGLKGTYPARWEEGKFVWQPTEQVRYIIQLNEKGQWFEIGEYHTGDKWIQFFEMTLDKL
ncbi:hypothetical protein [Algoriphagus sp.]|uniref:hypothetical protein n=1 Tax=Algoriphagus sp. TaxID=1872435 RepID=UPI0026178B5F|nr:hypothetical protein [Algoriphagus sp.]